MVSFTLNDKQVSVDADPEHPAALGHSRSCRSDRHQIRLRRRPLRRLHRASRWQGDARLPDSS